MKRRCFFFSTGSPENPNPRLGFEHLELREPKDKAWVQWFCVQRCSQRCVEFRVQSSGFGPLCASSCMGAKTPEPGSRSVDLVRYRGADVHGRQSRCLPTVISMLRHQSQRRVCLRHPRIRGLATGMRELAKVATVDEGFLLLGSVKASRVLMLVTMHPKSGCLAAMSRSQTAVQSFSPTWFLLILSY